MGLFYRVKNPTFDTLELYKKPIILEYFNDDGIHPNNAGNALILNNCYKEYYIKQLTSC